MNTLFHLAQTGLIMAGVCSLVFATPLLTAQHGIPGAITALQAVVLCLVAIRWTDNRHAEYLARTEQAQKA